MGKDTNQTPPAGTATPAATTPEVKKVPKITMADVEKETPVIRIVVAPASIAKTEAFLAEALAKVKADFPNVRTVKGTLNFFD